MTTTPQIRVDLVSPAYWTATFDHGPLNLMDLDTVRELDALVTRLETDPDVRVIVFRSANPDFFVAHWDLLADRDATIAMPPGRTGMHPYLDVFSRLSRVPVATVAAIRGRVRGAGSEFLLACDIRFASRERAVLGQFEVGIAAPPGGGAMVRLPQLLGRGRALEILLGGDDFTGELAERYGYVNRAVPDSELDDFVDTFARRIASFDKQALGEIKAFVDANSLPDDSVFPPALQAFLAATGRPATQQRAAELFARGLQQDGDGERRLGHHIAQLDQPALDGS
jgi:enoyl-CoA hydratase/carnithine racemase